MNEFIVSSYEMVLTEDGQEVMKVSLYKPTEYLESGKIVGVAQTKRPIGIAGNVELVVYEKSVQELYKSKLGKTIQVSFEL